jgi:tetratricopeptide (TPR) repeat protein
MNLEKDEQELIDYKKSISKSKYKKNSIINTIKKRLKEIDTSERTNIKTLLQALDEALNNPNIVPINLLQQYIFKLSDIMMDYGGGHFFIVYIDKSIQYYENLGLSTFELYLSKYNYLSLNNVESLERENILTSALTKIVTEEEKIKALIILAQYYQDASEYKKTLETSNEILNIIKNNKRLEIYKSKILNILGMHYYYKFEFSKARKYLKQTIVLLNNDSKFKDRLTVANHYLGRIELAEGNPSQALEYYIKALNYQEKYFISKVGERAYSHLRIAELLISVNLVSYAFEHLDESRKLFDSIYTYGSPIVHLNLAWSDLYIKEKNYKKAEKSLIKAIEQSKNIGFPRGELLAYEKLFWLKVKSFQFISVFTIFIQAMNTWRKGEMNRNGGIKLLIMYMLKLPTTFINKMKGSAHGLFSQKQKKGTKKITFCNCSMGHKK